MISRVFYKKKEKNHIVGVGSYILVGSWVRFKKSFL